MELTEFVGSQEMQGAYVDPPEAFCFSNEPCPAARSLPLLQALLK